MKKLKFISRKMFFISTSGVPCDGLSSSLYTKSMQFATHTPSIVGGRNLVSDEGEELNE